MPAVSVILPARDAAATLPRALAALGAQGFAGETEVIVVDDGSRDETARLAREGGAEVVEQEPAGPAAARNRGAAAAGGAVLAFTDADCFPAPGWLSAGMAALEHADLVQGAVLPDPEADLGPFDRTVRVENDHGLFETASLFVRRELFEAGGGFESWLGPREGKELGEDVWFGWRARRAGARVEFCPEALVHHAVFPRGPAEYVAERARLRFFPLLAARIPELRDALFWRRLFLNRRTAAFDAALAGMAAAGLRRSRGGLLLALPYAALVAAEARRWTGREVEAAAVGVAADAVGAASLFAGSVRARTLVL